MFSEIIDFTNCCADDKKIDFLYAIFKDDFVNNDVHLNGTVYIDPKSHDKEDGKEKVFCHIVTKVNPKTKKREFDENRASRIKWIKKIIENYFNHQIKLFYHYEEKQKVIRLYLWAYNKDFIVIIQKLGKKSSYLVTSFYIDKNYNRKIYDKRFETYINKSDDKLKGCEWF